MLALDVARYCSQFVPCKNVPSKWTFAQREGLRNKFRAMIVTFYMGWDKRLGADSPRMLLDKFVGDMIVELFCRIVFRNVSWSRTSGGSYQTQGPWRTNTRWPRACFLVYVCVRVHYDWTRCTI